MLGLEFKGLVFFLDIEFYNLSFDLIFFVYERVYMRYNLLLEIYIVYE